MTVHKASTPDVDPDPTRLLKQRVERHFSTVSGTYHEKNYETPIENGQYPDILVRHRRILEMVRGRSGKALDIGCGSGRLLLDLQRRGFDVAGVDCSQAMVDAARSLLLRSGTSRLPCLAIGDIERLEIEDAAFDLVVAAGVIEYLGTDDLALAEISRILKPGGDAIVSVRNKINLSRPLVLARDLLLPMPGVGPVVRLAHRMLRRVVPAAEIPYWPDIRRHRPREFHRILERHGLEVEDAAFYHFMIVPHVLRRRFPRASIRVGLAFERLSRTGLGYFGTAYLVKARKRVGSPEPPVREPADRAATALVGRRKRKARPEPSLMRAAPPAVVVRLGVTGLGVLRSLSSRASSVRIPLIAVDSSFSQPAARSRLCRRSICEDVDSPAVVDHLVDLGRTFSEKPVLFLTDDSTVLLVSGAEERLRPYYRFLLPRPGMVRLLAEKTEFAAFAEANGFSIPRTFVVKRRSDLLEALDSISFPCILKPSHRPAHWEKQRLDKAFLLDDREALLNAHQRYEPVHSDFVVQEWIAGADSEIFFCLAFLDAESRRLGSFTGRKIRQWPVGTGSSSMTEPVHCPEIERETTRLFELLGHQGFGSMEFKRDPRDGSFRIMEPTVGRPNLQSELATANGVNLHWIAYAHLAGIDPGNEPAPVHPTRWVYEYAELKSGLQHLREGNLTLREWARSYRGRKHFALFSWKDPLPLAAAAGRMGTNAAKRAFETTLGTLRRGARATRMKAGHQESFGTFRRA